MFSTEWIQYARHTGCNMHITRGDVACVRVCPTFTPVLRDAGGGREKTDGDTCATFVCSRPHPFYRLDNSKKDKHTCAQDTECSLHLHIELVPVSSSAQLLHPSAAARTAQQFRVVATPPKHGNTNFVFTVCTHARVHLFWCLKS